MQLRDLFFGRMTDNGDGTCRVEKIESGTGGRQSYERVGAPNIAGTGSSGLHISHGENTVALCAAVDNVAHTGDAGVVILCVIPEQAMYLSNDKVLPSDAPTELTLYADLDPNDPASPDIIMQGPDGGSMSINALGQVSIKNGEDMGLLIDKMSDGTCIHSVSEEERKTTNAKSSWSGKVMRFYEDAAFIPTSITDNRMRHDYDGFSHEGLREIGIFPGVEAWPFGGNSASWMSRNPTLAETVTFCNEYVSTSSYSGGIEEADRRSGSIEYTSSDDTNYSDRKPGNVLYLNENRLICSVKGNVVCPKGFQLDINFNPVRPGGADGAYPSDSRSDKEKWHGVASRTRRGIASLFQVGTNTFSSDKKTSQANYVSLVDKEGVIKVSIPKTSHTGNILFSSNTDYVGAEDSPITTFKNPSKIEPIPVTLRSPDGLMSLPWNAGDSAVDAAIGERFTGMAFHNGIDQNRYFPSDESAVRVNLTAYHNMCSTAERLLSNLTTKVVNLYNKSQSQSVNPILPLEFSASSGLPFHWPGRTGVKYPGNTHYAIVKQGLPAVNPGGAGQVYCGRDMSDYKQYSNAFTAKDNGDGTVILGQEGPSGKVLASTGGFSANINSEGAIISSIGKSDHEGISFILDTAGSIVSRIGMDNEGRSLIFDSDGDVFVSVGGSYSGDYDDDNLDTNLVMRPGRLEVRVNIADLGHVGRSSKLDKDYAGTDTVTKGDFVISISKAGMTISGNGGSHIPMIIRNDGPLEITSGSTLTIGGAQGLFHVQPDGQIVELGKPLSH